MNLNLRQLRIFVEVARRGSVVRAAEALHLTAPAVSQQIKALEDELGQSLFDRGGRRMSLDTAGEYFLQHARRVLAAADDADDAMRRYNEVGSGQLTIAMVSAAKYFVPQLLARFHASFPDLDIRIRIGSREQLHMLMQERQVDLCVMGRTQDALPLVVTPFAAHPHVLVVSPQHPLAREERHRICASELAGEPFIAREPTSGTRAVSNGYFAEHRIEPRIVMEIGSNEGIKQAVMAELGISIVSQHIIALEWTRGLIASPPVEGLPVMRDWHVVHAANRELSPSAVALKDFLIEEAAGHLEHMFDGGR